MPARITRAAYADMFGPTVGDRVRLVRYGGGRIVHGFRGETEGAV